MAYEVVMLYHLHMPSYFLGTFTEYPYTDREKLNIVWGKLCCQWKHIRQNSTTGYIKVRTKNCIWIYTDTEEWVYKYLKMYIIPGIIMPVD